MRAGNEEERSEDGTRFGGDTVGRRGESAQPSPPRHLSILTHRFTLSHSLGMAALTDSNAGFSFENALRNRVLGQRNLHLPKATSTGTTIVGVVYESGIVLGADTRATEGPIVADKNCEKIHYISEHIRCCGAGTAADTEFTTNMISSNIKLHELSTGRPPLVATAMTMLKQYLFQFVSPHRPLRSINQRIDESGLYRYQGQVGAALVLGGIDPTGPHLYTVAPHGSTDKLPYVTMGSGSLAAMAVFETYWKPNMTRQEAIDVVSEAIEAGIWNDLGSGSNVDVCVIEGEQVEGKYTGKAKTDYLRNYRTPNEKVTKERNYKWRRGVTAWTKEEVKKLIVAEEVVPLSGGLATGPEGSGAGASEMEVDA
ncbi:putative Proteasome subunit, beta type, 7 [Rhodotorula toruloides ATCC 204091]|uniref:proteasome endopeptidase complex n=1 Tax=Rhodotorula toruloides TaxID=5286 RepID=A0A2T0A456_RHOTO|nr:putative Proteasome subunit, beta type, 7 [Rhodotorula toruloides ATCC 204091]PRQ72804.1 putative proteasome subunit, beta type, 7 [Rhodotorula toruloides]